MSAIKLWKMNPAMEAAGISRLASEILEFDELAEHWMSRPSEFEELETGFLPLTERQKTAQAKADNEAKRNKPETILRQKVDQTRPRHIKRHKPVYETIRDNRLMEVC